VVSATGAASHTIAAAALRADVEAVLAAAGADAQAAAVVAGSLVGSDRRGVASHGFIRVAEYLEAIRAGRIIPTARPRRVYDAGPVIAYDGERAFGQLVAGELADAVAARAREVGACVGTLSGVAHVGRVGEWVERAAAGGCVALAWCNCGDPGGNVVPFGGAEPRLGTNPIAYAIPLAGRPPLVADFSTSAVSEGRVRLARDAGHALPQGWVVDGTGAPTTDPRALYAGGALLPMGAHKGFALGLLAELMGGVLAGGACASLGEQAGNGLVLIAIDPVWGRHGPGFAERAAAVVDAIAATPPARDTEGVVIPGAPEALAARRAEREGIACSSATWQTFADAAASVGVDVRQTTGPQAGQGRHNVL
jgi:uncharacterized oxidoreductase